MKPTRPFTIVALAGICAIAAFSQDTRAQDASEASKIRKGYSIAPVLLNVADKNVALVGLGSYIVNGQGGCTDCHTNPPYLAGGDPFLGEPTVINQSGYLAGGTAFGPFVSRNLTPNRFGRPANLSLDDFMFVMTTGIDVKGTPPFVPSVEGDLLQVMPWPVYRHMTERDIRAIYEYLRAIPCIGSAQRCGT